MCSGSFSDAVIILFLKFVLLDLCLDMVLQINASEKIVCMLSPKGKNSSKTTVACNEM